MADVAINDSTVSIIFGKYAATLSFSLTLIDLKKVINIRCDNAEENIDLDKKSKVENI